MGDNPWTYILIFVAVGVVFSIGYVFLNAFLVSRFGTRYADKLWRECKKDLTEMLPGKNCGECGRKDCAAYAEAVLYAEAPSDRCPYGDETLPARLDEYVQDLQDELKDPAPPGVREDKYGHKFWM
jgi:Na+-translocating ferredoxin:NAD+ oxidoreductase RNF subunit RnfB